MKREPDTSQQTEILAVYGAWDEFSKRARQLVLDHPELDVQFVSRQPGVVSIAIMEKK